jgi:hypothetical protein
MDSVPSRSVPVVTRGLILVNVIVFFFELALPQQTMEQLFYLFGIVPARFVHPDWAAQVHGRDVRDTHFMGRMHMPQTSNEKRATRDT